MAIVFDPINKYIKITSGTEITALAIYNAVMDWCDEQENIAYTVPMRAIGKASMGGGIYSDSIFILQNGWKIKLYDGTYQFTITGTLIALDEAGDPYPRTEPPDSGNVEVIFQVSSQGTLIVSGSGVTEQDKLDIAEKTWEHTKGSEVHGQTKTEIPTQITEVQIQTENIEIISEGQWKIEGEYLIMYKRDDPTKIHRKFKLIKDDEGKIIERIPV